MEPNEFASSPLQSVPQQRIVQKLDEYMSHRDYAGAQRHLLYWLEEARALDDRRGELMVRNELVGHFRKVGDKRQALLHGDEALRLVDELGFGATISAGTTYTNMATACNAFGENERAMELFEKAEEVYRSSPQTSPQLIGGLHNNMALTCVSLGRFCDANRHYRAALAAMETVEGGQLEQAITYLNMADAVAAQAEMKDAEEANAVAAKAQTQTAGTLEPDAVEEKPNGTTGPDTAKAEGTTPELAGDDDATAPAASCEADADPDKTIEAYLDTALELLDSPSVPRDGYYAFVCEKCAPAFGYHGYFLAEADLRERAKAIYERA